MIINKSRSTDGLWWSYDANNKSKRYYLFGFFKVVSEDNLRLYELIIWRWRFVIGW